MATVKRNFLTGCRIAHENSCRMKISHDCATLFTNGIVSLEFWEIILLFSPRNRVEFMRVILFSL